MFPAPSNIPTYDSLRALKAQKARKQVALGFVPPPSRLVPHQCPSLNTKTVSTRCGYSGVAPHSPATPNTPSKPLTTLLLSLPLAQKISGLILASRQIEALARGWFSGSDDKDQLERRMSDLEEQYDALRNEVECELESAWVNAGYLSADIPTFPPSRKTPGSDSVKPAIPKQGLLEDIQGNENYTIDKALKRKRKEEQHTANKKSKHSSDHYSDSEEEVNDASYPQSIQPIGMTKAMERLKPWEKNVMKTFNLSQAERGRQGVRMRKVLWDECVSPHGTFTKFW